MKKYRIVPNPESKIPNDYKIIIIENGVIRDLEPRIKNNTTTVKK